jgi:uncharacterized protein
MSDAPAASLGVEVVYAEPGQQALISLAMTTGSSVADAIAQSGLAARFPGVDLLRLAVGIWGHPVAHDHVLQDGDRVELYRPLTMDPREARRQLAEHGRAMGQKRNDPGDAG